MVKEIIILIIIIIVVVIEAVQVTCCPNVYANTS